MPETPVAPHEGAPYDPLMEARVARLEEDMREVKTAWSRAESSLVRIETLLEAVLPNLATKADLAELRGRMEVGFAEIRAETKGDIAALRSETHAGLAALRAETKADNAEVKLAIARLDANKPSKAYMWLVMTALLAAYASGLAALAVLK